MLAGRKNALVEALAETGNVTRAAKAAEVGRRTHYLWLESDPEYVAAVQDAMERAADKLEEEAVRRAVEGVDEPVHYQGERVDTVRKYSDRLLEFLLKGARPEKYRERIDHRVEEPKEDPEIERLREFIRTDPEIRARIDQLQLEAPKP